MRKSLKRHAQIVTRQTVAIQVVNESTNQAAVQRRERRVDIRT